MALVGWESPSDGRRVLLNETVVQNLRKLAIEGLVALPRRGVEVGGVLVGDVRSGDMFIEGSEEAPCEHRYGPSYALSDADWAALGRLIAERQDEHPPIVGFFRSFASREPIIEEADESFVREHFPEGDFVFLALQPRSTESCVASFRFFHDGKPLSESDDPPFAFDAQKMAAVVEPADNEPESAPPPLLLKRFGVTRPMPHRSGLWIATGIILLLSAVAGAGLYALAGGNRPPVWADLRLDARPQDGNLRVTWDANALRGTHVERGLLAITDGDALHRVYLNADQLRTGQYVYTPGHGDVALRLILYANGTGVAGDTVRLTQVQIPIVAEEPKPVTEADRTVSPDAPDRGAAVSSLAAVPPAAIHEVQPRISRAVRSRLKEQVVIPVNVEVSEQGRVTRAVAAIPPADSTHRYLAGQAQKAAREWRFKPARNKDGARVPATTIVHFVVTPLNHHKSAG